MYWECDVCCNCFFEDAGLTVAPALTLPGPHGSGATSALFRASYFVFFAYVQNKNPELMQKRKISLRTRINSGYSAPSASFSLDPRGPRSSVRPGFGPASLLWRLAPPCRKIYLLISFTYILTY